MFPNSFSGIFCLYTFFLCILHLYKTFIWILPFYYVFSLKLLFFHSILLHHVTPVKKHVCQLIKSLLENNTTYLKIFKKIKNIWIKKPQANNIWKAWTLFIYNFTICWQHFICWNLLLICSRVCKIFKKSMMIN